MDVIDETHRLLAVIGEYKLVKRRGVEKQVRELRATVARLKKQLPNARLEMDEYILQSMPLAGKYQQARCQLAGVEARLGAWDANRSTHVDELRRISGQQYDGCITPEIYRFIQQRLADDFGPTDIALMVGCSDSTVGAIKTGRYRLSQKPATARIGARGHRRNPI